MEFEKFEVIPMTKESKWEDDNTPLEDAYYTQDFEFWYNDYNSKPTSEFYRLLTKGALNVLHKIRKNKSYMTSPVCIYKNKVYNAKSIVFFNVEQLIDFVSNNDIVLYNIATSLGGITQKFNVDTFEPLDEIILNEQIIRIRYAEFEE